MSGADREIAERWLNEFQDRHPEDQENVDRFRALLRGHPECFSRDCWAGHITGAAWLLDPSLDRVLMTHHRKLDRWLQLGGHSDGDPDPLAVARREAEEESGLAVRPIGPGLLDIDIHLIPARKAEPEHFHFDLRFAFLSASGTDYAVSDESHDLAWVELDRLGHYTDESSLHRMARRWQGWVDQGLVDATFSNPDGLC